MAAHMKKRLGNLCLTAVVLAWGLRGTASAGGGVTVETIQTNNPGAEELLEQQAPPPPPLCWQAIPGCLECDSQDSRFCARCADEWNFDLAAGVCVCNAEHVTSTDLQSCIPLADVAQVCLGAETSCTPGKPGVTLQNLIVGAGGATFNGDVKFMRPADFSAAATFHRGLHVRLQALPPFERRAPINAIPAGASYVDVGALARHNNGVVALPMGPERGQRVSIMSAQRYRLVARGGDAVNGRSEDAFVDVPADVLVDCVCLVVREGPKGDAGGRRASWACTQLDESGALTQMQGEGAQRSL